MKLRTTLLVSALVAISACGGSNDSTSRNRNNLLVTTTIPGAVTTTVPSAVTTTVVGVTTIPSVTTTIPLVTTTEAKTPTTTGLPVLVPVPTSSSTTSAPTTTIPQVVVEATAKTFKDAFSKGGCGTGGMCQITNLDNKQKGPKGGWIIGVSEAGFTTKNPAVSNHFLEMGPPVNVPACNKTIKSKSTSSQELSQELVDDKCITSLRDDWYIPGDEEMQYILDYSRKNLSSNSREAQPFREAFYQKFLTSSTTCGLGSTFFYPFHDFMNKPVKCFDGRGLSSLSRNTWIIPVRSFGPTVRACALGGPCKTGDIGPRGGIVVNSEITDGRQNKFFEAMTSPEYLRVGAWCGPFLDSNTPRQPESGFLNTASLYNDGTSGLPCDVVLNKDNRSGFGQSLTTMDESLFVPAAWELKLLCVATQTMKRLDLRAQKQCGISKDFTKDSDPTEPQKTSNCPVSIYCKNDRGEYTKQMIDFVWTSSPVGAGKNLILKSEGLINGWSFGSSTMSKRAMYRVDNYKENTSRGITLPFREFTALVAK